MGWRYNAGLLLIAAVVIIWVTPLEVTQVFAGFVKPNLSDRLSQFLGLQHH